MAITLGHNQYGKAETRVVRVYRDSDPHEIVDYNVSVALSGDFEDIHRTGDNGNCLTTDATKNTVNAFAKEYGEAARQPESFGIALAKHFVDDTAPVSRARIKLEMYPWNRLPHNGTPHPHAFARDGGLRAHRHRHLRRHQPVGGVRRHGLRGAQDHRLGVLGLPAGPLHHAQADQRPGDGHLGDRAVVAHRPPTPTGRKSYDSAVSATMSSVFAGHHSLALQQTMFAMGEAMIAEQPEIGEVRFSLPNKHHFVIDLSPYGLENPNEVFHADDRPYGFIEGTIHNDDAPAPGQAFDPGQGW